MTAGRVSVVIPNFNGAHLLTATLDALQAQTVTGFEVVVVDNGSTDRSVEMLMSRRDVRLMALPRNRGFAGGVNAGVASVTAEFVAVLNSDARPAPDWLERLLEVVDTSDEDVWAWGSVLLDESGNIESAGDAWRATAAYKLLRGREVAALPPTPYEVFAPPGAAPLCRRDVLTELCGYDERFFLYYEDIDLSWRARLAGYRVLLVPSARVCHLGSATTKADPDRERRAWFYIARNSLWCAVRCPPVVHPRTVVRDSFRELARARQRGVGRAYAWGRLMGVAGLPQQLRIRHRLQAGRSLDQAALAAFLARQDQLPSLSQPD